MRILKDEKGRSMVEMLSVLAIMGLMTLTFILSYRYAMDRHRSHVIISRLTEMATGASGQMILKNDFNLDEFKSTGDTYPYIQGKYPVMLEKNYAGHGNHFALSVSGVSKMVCDFILQYHWKMPIETKVNDGAGCQDLDDGNVMLFAFNSDLVGGNTGVTPTETASDCPNISYSTCKSNGYSCVCTESDESNCITLIMKRCGATPEYHYTH